MSKVKGHLITTAFDKGKVRIFLERLREFMYVFGRAVTNTCSYYEKI